jgi:DNA-binding transcriptional regulator YhcF (GntR family)
MEFRKQKPIYLQIADRLMEQVLAGELKEEDRVPSVRDVAEAMGVNPNTVMRTFEYLQGEEIIYNRRGVGYFVSPDARKRILDQQRREFLQEELPLIRQRMQLLGISLDELKNENTME